MCKSWGGGQGRLVGGNLNTMEGFFGTGKCPYEILLEVMGDVSIPILADFDCCHTHPMLTLPIGCYVTLDATHKKVILMESPLINN